MIRGRRGIVVGVFLLATLFITTTAHAWDLGMTATVPLSPLWRDLIAEHSDVILDTRSHRNIAALSVRLRGNEVVNFPKQTVQALLFRNDDLVENQVKETETKGLVDFTFVYKIGESYRIMIVDTTDDSPFVIRTVSF